MIHHQSNALAPEHPPRDEAQRRRLTPLEEVTLVDVMSSGHVALPDHHSRGFFRVSGHEHTDLTVEFGRRFDAANVAGFGQHDTRLWQLLGEQLSDQEKQFPVPADID